MFCKKMLSLLLCMAVFQCFAESFVVEEKQKKTRPDHQVKQEILDLMGTIAELESDAIKTKAEIQKACTTQIRSYLAGSKNTFLTSASRKDLQRIVHQLRQEAACLEKSIAADQKLLQTLKKPLAVQ